MRNYEEYHPLECVNRTAQFLMNVFRHNRSAYQHPLDVSVLPKPRGPQTIDKEV